jgi:hypothetical protein
MTAWSATATLNVSTDAVNTASITATDVIGAALRAVHRFIESEGIPDLGRI